MKKFRYKAKKGPEEVVTGLLTAESQDEAIDKINEMGLLPIDVEVDEPRAPAKQAIRRVRPKKISAHELAVFSRQLTALVKSGVPILRGISIISEQSFNLYLKDVLERIRDSVREGNNLSSAMAQFPSVFSTFDVAMIQAGESAGKIDEALLAIAKYREDEERVLAKVRSAIAYPLFVISLGVATVGFMLTYVIPKFSSFFLDLGQELPLPTRILITASQWAQISWIWVLALALIPFFLIRKMRRSKTDKIHLDRFLIRLPKIGPMILKTEIVRFSRSLQLLLGSGMQMLGAIRTTIPVVGNEAVRQELEQCYKAVEDGGNFSEKLRNSTLFPKFVHHLTSIGEESGRLDSALGEVAAWYEQELEEHIKIMMNLLEPAVILIVGLILGLMIIAVLLPIFSMNAMVQ